MLSAENIKDAELRRLTWRCRRGMLELDIVLQRFIMLHFNDLTLTQLQALDELLALPDNDFWALISGHSMASNNAGEADVLNKIKALKPAH